MNHDALAAGLAGAVGSAVPSTTLALARREDPLEGARAVGLMVLPNEHRTPVLLAAASAIHLALSFGWATVLTRVPPRHHQPTASIAGSLAIAGLDLVVIGRHIPPIRALPQPRQWADHIAFGLAVGLTLRARRGRARHGRPVARPSSGRLLLGWPQRAGRLPT